MARGPAQRAVADGRSQRHHPGSHRGLWSTWLARPHLERGELREVLGALKGRSYPINALWPHSPHLPLKTRMAIDWLASRLPEQLASVNVPGHQPQ